MAERDVDFLQHTLKVNIWCKFSENRSSGLDDRTEHLQNPVVLRFGIHKNKWGVHFLALPNSPNYRYCVQWLAA